MQSFDPENFKTINTIIERDNKDTTYKFALLRGVIEISQEYQHQAEESGDHLSLLNCLNRILSAIVRNVSAINFKNRTLIFDICENLMRDYRYSLM